MYFFFHLIYTVIVNKGQEYFHLLFSISSHSLRKDKKKKASKVKLLFLYSLLLVLLVLILTAFQKVNHSTSTPVVNSYQLIIQSFISYCLALLLTNTESTQVRRILLRQKLWCKNPLNVFGMGQKGIFSRRVSRPTQLFLLRHSYL